MDNILIDGRNTLKHLGACKGATGWAEEQADHSARALWEACPRPSWALWLLYALYARGAINIKQLVRAVRSFVALVVRELDSEPQLGAARRAFHRVEGWLDGTVSSEDLRIDGTCIVSGYTANADGAARAVSLLIYTAIEETAEHLLSLRFYVEGVLIPQGATSDDDDTRRARGRMLDALHEGLPWNEVEAALLALYVVRDPDYPERNEATLIAGVVGGVAITHGRIRDLLCVGLEGGIGYWGRARVLFQSEDKSPWPGEKEYSPDLDAPLRVGGLLSIQAHPDSGLIGDEGPRTRHHVQLASLLEGLDIMANDYASNFQDFVNGDEAAITGDVFLQCVCFKKLVFS